MARRLAKEHIISNVYYDLEKGFGSIQDTLKLAKEQDPSITTVDVETFMKKQPNKQIRGYRGSNSYTAPFSWFEYQIDIVHMKPLTKVPEAKIPMKNSEPPYALVVIDIFSKMGDVVPMKQRDGETVLPALKQSFKKMGFPMSIYSDDDGAFQTVVSKFLQGRRHKSHHHKNTRQCRGAFHMIHDTVRLIRQDGRVCFHSS